jgi:predicted Fe-Mo cluster-binding NifX family protein
MKVCFPVQTDSGIGSTVYNHFGSAPFFIVIDTDTKSASTITNQDQHHTHGACNPIKALNNQDVDAIVVGGIGAGALNRLNQIGITVYRAGAVTIQENLEIFLSAGLAKYNAQSCCGGHGHGTGCAH